MKKVGTLSSGDSFGELALFYGAKRMATIFTETETDFIVLSKEVYEKILK